MRVASATEGPTLDMQVLDGLETYIASEQFLHKLEQASAEWIDLSEHQHHAICASKQPVLELTQVTCDQQQSSAEPAAAASSQASPGHIGGRSSSDSSSSKPTLLGRWSRSLSWSQSKSSNSKRSPATAVDPIRDGSVSLVEGVQPALAASCFEVVDQQPPLHQDLSQQEPFVLVSSEDAIEGMAYYIAVYLSRAPEARNMDPKQLQAALKQTFTHIRRSRYKVVWDWGRTLYKWGAVSYSALQLYEHPWLVRALLCAIWTSSKMALGILV
eukprot:GHUV01001534.1.p1 GENE.GHUV01001534.1~~GHUV01001534.1.p1  ORF type:complete len:271 (+),score=94.73 GHUV01001534.1:308-1120(+)